MLIPYPGIIMCMIYNCCNDQLHDFKHKCSKCDHKIGTFKTRYSDACICNDRYKVDLSKPPMDIYRGKGVD